MNQKTHSNISLVRRNDSLQQLVNDRKLYIEVLLQTLEVKTFDSNKSDVKFIIRYHDRDTKEYTDVTVITENKFNEVRVGGNLTTDPVREILNYLTLSINQIKDSVARP
mmetsp:Transcript_10409/g.11668  ORF Transcript_10409/g.11668 Transcript_10409/m.11668 type:complete len:109 (-) Transcript_10409:12-338(-)